MGPAWIQVAWKPCLRTAAAACAPARHQCDPHPVTPPGSNIRLRLGCTTKVRAKDDSLPTRMQPRTSFRAYA
ncbi:hypothetical protein PENSPDRAFT_656785 [Peniophora sp. CONT]|nr:hypothetical protein PENSPDRAFT_656785 [Peniophora sp. CONT]